jgi:hypothetical protein
MTLGAVQTEMCPGQREPRQVVVKGRRQPSACGMAGSTIPAEPSVVVVILSVAGEAVAGCGFEILVDMATCARNVDMFPGEFERKEIMVDVDRQPSGGGMTQGTIHTELAVVLVILLMAGETIAGSPLKNMIDMAAVTSHCNMPAVEFERGKVVVKGCWRPARRSVAGTTIGAQPALVGILIGMAGEAVLGSGTQVFQRPGVGMAITAGNL